METVSLCDLQCTMRACMWSCPVLELRDSPTQSRALLLLISTVVLGRWARRMRARARRCG